jgi:hypothetical protein
MPGGDEFGEKPVKWLSPTQLGRTAAEVAQAGIFAKYADKREVMAGVQAPVFTLDTATSDLWFDYVADTGDGFDATYAVACAVARAPNVTVVDSDDCDHVPAGEPRPLVLGGDEVYPVASADGYQKRLVKPFRLAREQARPRQAQDLIDPVIALPGNHDWYDGLVAFRRTFCEVWAKQKYAHPTGPELEPLPDPAVRDDVAGWGAFQARSYYALRLTETWWLWGLDSQLDKPIDAAQMRYFRDAAEHLDGDQSIILCVATPSWLEAGYIEEPKTDGALDTLVRFVNRVLGDNRRRVRLILTGDKHHFAHYAPDEGDDNAFRPELVTCGGGGAFMSSTHHLPEGLDVPWGVPGTGAGPPKLRYERRATYPDAETTSAQLSRSPRWLSVLTRNGWLPALFVAIQFLLLLPLMRIGRTYEFLNGEYAWFEAIPRGIAAMVGVLLLFLVLLAFTRHGTEHTAISPLGPAVLHTLAHVTPLVIAAVLVSRIDDNGLRIAVLLGVVIVLASWSCLVFAAYLHVADRLGFHELESYSGLRIEGFKCLLRVHVESERLVLHAIGIESVPEVRTTGRLDAPIQGHHIGQRIVIEAHRADGSRARR